MDFKISDTNKGKKSLIYDGFIYRIDGVLKCGDISWRCTNKKCKGRLRTDSAMSTLNAINLEHNHEQDEKKVFSMVLITRYDYNMFNLSK